MGVPVVTLHPDRESYAPGDVVTVTVRSVDPDNTAETLVTEGEDAQRNQVRVTQTIERIDPFRITRAYWASTGEPLTVTGMTVTGKMPSA